MLDQIIIEGETHYDNEGNGGYSQWAYVGGKSVLDLLNLLFAGESWHHKAPRKVRVTVEKIVTDEDKMYLCPICREPVRELGDDVVHCEKCDVIHVRRDSGEISSSYGRWE